MKYDNSMRCRTCLSNTLNLTPLASTILIENSGVDITFIDLIKECASVEISFKDSRPQSICNLCVENARISYTFRRRCKDSEFLLSQEENASDSNMIPLDFEFDDKFSSEDEKPLSVLRSHDLIRNSKRIPKCQLNNKAICVKRQKQQKHKIMVRSFAKMETNGKTHFSQKDSLSDIMDESKDTPNFPVSTISKKQILLSPEEIDEFKTEDGKEYTCPICNRTFKLQKTFTLHLKRHDESKWKLKFADTITIMSENSNCSSADLALQMSACKDENNKTHLCPICNKSFSEIKYLQRHVRRHQASGRLSIRNFNKKLNHQIIMKEKIAKMVNPVNRKRKNINHQQQFACNLCNSLFPKRILLKDHLKEVHNVSKIPSKCSYCEWTGNAADLAKHKEEHSEFKNFQCEYCEKKFFNKKSLQIHTLIHTGEKKHMCHYCGKSFAVKHNLKMHIRTHTGEKPYKCTMCEKTFAQKSEVTVHMITHSEERNYVCSVCGVTCRRKGALRDHLRSHLPVEEWDKCNVCGKAFRTKEQLKDHMHQHTGERNHVCNICGKDYGRRRNLRTHIKMIHTTAGQSNAHLCMVCGKNFTQKHVLSTHMKTHEK